MKQTLHEIKRKTTITTQSLAQQAGLSLGEVFTVEVGGYTCREKALRVVHAFNQLSGMRLTVEDIMIREVRKI